MNQTEQLAGKAAQTKRAMERLESVDKPREPWQLRLDVPDAPRSGDIVARLSDAVVERGNFRLGPVDLLIEYGERIALVGHNGAGKTTLISLILGRIEPDAGLADLGSGVRVGEIEQVRRQLIGDATLGRTFSDATGLDLGDARTLLAKFGLVGDHVDRRTASLSPGERTRAGLALLMANGANLLVLDERPTTSTCRRSNSSNRRSTRSPARCCSSPTTARCANASASTARSCSTPGSSPSVVADSLGWVRSRAGRRRRARARGRRSGSVGSAPW